MLVLLLSLLMCPEENLEIFITLIVLGRSVRVVSRRNDILKFQFQLLIIPYYRI